MTTQLTVRPPKPPAVGGHDASLARRRAKDRFMTAVLVVLMTATLAVLAWVLVYVAGKGVQYLNLNFFTHVPPGNPSLYGGGLAPSIVGSFIIVGIATVISVPIGIAAAVALVEFGGRFAAVTSFVTDVLIGVPSIVIGAFIYSLWVVHFGFSGLAGSVALAIIMLPLVIRATAEMLRLVPVALREASVALGVSQARTIISVVIPSARAGIITGVMLAVARAMGETAPLLLTTLGNEQFLQLNPTHRMDTLSLAIFANATTGFTASQSRAWAGALTLIFIVLVLAVGARVIGRRVSTVRS